jgi:hypothetical protein
MKMSVFKKTVTTNPTVLETLQIESQNAISVLLDTIAQLEATNNAIEVEYANNESRIVKLNETNNALDALKGNNAKIISNFEKLLS